MNHDYYGYLAITFEKIASETHMAISSVQGFRDDDIAIEVFKRRYPDTLSRIERFDYGYKDRPLEEQSREVVWQRIVVSEEKTIPVVLNSNQFRYICHLKSYNNSDLGILFNDYEEAKLCFRKEYSDEIRRISRCPPLTLIGKEDWRDVCI